jgi:hypothetical protein
MWRIGSPEVDAIEPGDKLLYIRLVSGSASGAMRG